MAFNKEIFERVTEISRQHGSLRKAAEFLQISHPFLCQVRSGKKQPSNRVLEKIGMRRVISFERVEHDQA